MVGRYAMWPCLHMEYGTRAVLVMWNLFERHGEVVPYIMWLIAVFWPWRSCFDTSKVSISLLVDKVVMGQVSVRVLTYFLSLSFQTAPYWFIYYRGLDSSSFRRRSYVRDNFDARQREYKRVKQKISPQKQWASIRKGLNVVHHVVFYNNAISTEESVKHNSNIILNTLLRVDRPTCFGLAHDSVLALHNL
jgi:hypothetical protein